MYFKKCRGQWVRYVCNVGVGDLPWVIASPHMFVNKIRLEQDPLAFLCLELWYRDRVQRQRHLPNGNDTFDVSVYASEAFVRNHVSIFLRQLSQLLKADTHYPYLFHDLLLRSYLYHCVWSVITAHNLTPEKRDNNYLPHPLIPTSCLRNNIQLITGISPCCGCM